MPEPKKVKMKDKLDEAIAKAKAKNPACKLVRIFGLAIESDGNITLGQQGKFTPRWEYAFMDDKNGEAPAQFLTVLYLAPKVPLVSDNAGNVGNKEPFKEETIPMIADSSVLASVFNIQEGYKHLNGNDSDSVIYYVDHGSPVVVISNWNGQCLRLDPFTLNKK